MRSLIRKDELILLSILNLAYDAYLITIQDHLISGIRKKMPLTSIPLSLSCLEKAELIDFSLGDATSVRSRRRKRNYKITTKGIEILRDYKSIDEILWANFTKPSTQQCK